MKIARIEGYCNLTVNNNRLNLDIINTKVFISEVDNMHKKILTFGLTLTLSASLLGCAATEKEGSLVNETQNQVEQQVVDQDLFEDEVRSLVEDFGTRLQNVSLLGPKDVLEESMEENYGGLVSQSLIEKWLENPEDAPGRLVSSPWPDRIEILDLELVSEEEYKVEGEIVEITNNEDDEDITRPITLNIRKIEDEWIIDDVILGEYEE